MIGKLLSTACGIILFALPAKSNEARNHLYFFCGLGHHGSFTIGLRDNKLNPGLYDLQLSGYNIDSQIGRALGMNFSTGWTIKIPKHSCNVTTSSADCHFYAPHYPLEVFLSHETNNGSVTLERQTFDWLDLRITKSVSTHIPTDMLLTLRRDGSNQSLAKVISFPAEGCFWDFNP